MILESHRYCLNADYEAHGRDEEWVNAWNANETTKYYKCKMLNGGTCYKSYKPSVAKLVLQRGAYRQMIQI